MIQQLTKLRYLKETATWYFVPMTPAIVTCDIQGCREYMTPTIVETHGTEVVAIEQNSEHQQWTLGEVDLCPAHKT